MKFGRKHTATAWLAISVISIMFMGIYAFLVALSRAPGFNLLFVDQSFFQTALVTHVVLSVVIWFLAFIMFITYYVTADSPVGTFDYTPAAVAAAGLFLIVVTPFTGAAYPMLNNYIPVLQRGSYFAGLGLFLGAVLLGASVRAPALIKMIRSQSPRYPVIVTGSLIGAGLSLAIGVVCILISFSALSSMTGIDRHIYYESLFWGGGHALQFANTMGLMACWGLLVSNVTGKKAIDDKLAFSILGIMLFFAALAPFEYFRDSILSAENRSFFTSLKGWGVGAGPLILGLAVVRLLPGNRADPVSKRGLSLSLLLFALGGFIAMTLSGSDTRVPAHYHGVIGAVTLCFMTFALTSMVENGWLKVRSKWLSAQLTLYGAGQALFVSGLFIGGLGGLPRKTFGAAQKLDSIIKITGMSVMGIGGLLAVAGGGLFVIFMLKALLGKDEDTVS